MQFNFAQQDVKKIINNSINEVLRLKKLIREKERILKGKDLALSDFKKITILYLKRIEEAQKSVKSQLDYYTYFSVFKENFEKNKKALEKAITELEYYLNSFVIHTETELIKPVLVSSSSSGLRKEELTLEEKQNAESFLDSALELLKDESPVLQDEKLLLSVKNFLKQDLNFMQLVYSLQKLKAEKDKKLPIADLFLKKYKQRNQKLDKQIAQQNVAIKKRIAVVVNAMLLKASEGKRYSDFDKSKKNDVEK